MIECDKYLKNCMKLPLIETLYENEMENIAVMDDASFAQPALFAVEYALSCFLSEHFGIEPIAVVGHSLGEFAALCVSGRLSVKEACHLVAARGLAMSNLDSNGSMVAVWASEIKVNQLLSDGKCNAIVAVVNGPNSVVVSGFLDDIEKAILIFENENIKAKRLRVTTGFHSKCVESALPRVKTYDRKFSILMLVIQMTCLVFPKFISTVTGTEISNNDISYRESMYWMKQARERVRFSDAMSCVLNDLDAM